MIALRSERHLDPKYAVPMQVWSVIGVQAGGIGGTVAVFDVSASRPGHYQLREDFLWTAGIGKSLSTDAQDSWAQQLRQSTARVASDHRRVGSFTSLSLSWQEKDHDSGLQERSELGGRTASAWFKGGSRLIVFLWLFPTGRLLGPDDLDQITEAHNQALPSLRAWVLDSQRSAEVPRVSPAERRVLELLVNGHTEPQIAKQLGRSVHTIHTHIRSLYRKMRVHNRAELIAASNGQRGDVLDQKDVKADGLLGGIS